MTAFEGWWEQWWAECREKARTEPFVSLAHDAWQAATERAAKVAEDAVAAYPESVFTPPPLGKHGKTVDGCSAAAIRAVLPGIAAKIRGDEG